MALLVFYVATYALTCGVARVLEAGSRSRVLEASGHEGDRPRSASPVKAMSEADLKPRAADRARGFQARPICELETPAT